MQQAREVWRSKQPQMPAGRLVFLDETSVNTKQVRLYGRAPGGARCHDQCPHGHWHSNTFLAALRHDRVTAPILFDGPIDGETFLAYVREQLAPTLNAGDIVVCDNLSSHKVAGVREAIETVGAHILYLPPYSPDLNPIEQLFSKLKADLRRFAARTHNALIDAINASLGSITPLLCANLFANSNYATT